MAHALNVKIASRYINEAYYIFQVNTFYSYHHEVKLLAQFASSPINIVR